MSVQPALFHDGELPPKPPELLQAGFDLWNEFARKNKWQIATDIDSSYRVALKRAIPDYGGLQAMRRILEMVERSDFYMGRVPPTGNYTKPFRAKLVWFLRKSTVTELKEQLYNGGGDPVTVAPRAGRIEPTGLNWRGILETYRPGRYWPSMQGNRPELAGPHLVPEEMLAAWRKKHGVTGMAGHNGPPQESLEERLRASIAGYRRIGRYDDANRVESKLAALLGRPAVHVPSPEVAHVGLDRVEVGKTSPPENGHFAGKPAPTSGRVRADLGKTLPVTDVDELEPPPWSDADVPVGDYEVEADD